MEEFKSIESKKLTREYLLELGYSSVDLEEFINHYSLKKYSDVGLRDKVSKIYAYFTILGLKKNEIKAMTLRCPQICTCTNDSIQRKIDFFKSLGYTEKELAQMIKKFPNVLNLGINTIKKKIDDLIGLGISSNTARKIVRRYPSILSLSINTVKNKIKNIMALDYEYADVIELTNKYPIILSIGIDNMQNKQNVLLSFGYSLEDTKKITLSFPSIYGYSIEALTEKLEFYCSINLLQVFILTPKYLMQSVDLSYARYMFYKDKNIEITESNYCMLFIGEKLFAKRFGINKASLLELYKYDEYKKNIKTRALI